MDYIDVTRLGLGIETAGGIFTRMIEKHSRMPCKKVKQFNTFISNQSSIAIKIFEGERLLTKDNTFKAKFELNNINIVNGGRGNIEITFDIDVNGMLTVIAKDLNNKDKDNFSKLRLEAHTGRMSGDEMATIIENGKKYQQDDEIAKENILKQNEQFVKILNSGLKNQDKLTKDEKQKFDQTVKATNGWIVDNDADNNAVKLKE